MKTFSILFVFFLFVTNTRGTSLVNTTLQTYSNKFLCNIRACSNIYFIECLTTQKIQIETNNNVEYIYANKRNC